MAQIIFSADLSDFCQKFLVIRPGTPEPAVAHYLSAMEQVRGDLFQNLLLFDKLSLKTTGESIPIPVLIGAFGQRGFDELLEQNALEFVIWTERAGFVTTRAAKGRVAQFRQAASARLLRALQPSSTLSASVHHCRARRFPALPAPPPPPQ